MSDVKPHETLLLDRIVKEYDETGLLLRSLKLVAIIRDRERVYGLGCRFPSHKYTVYKCISYACDFT